MGLSPLQHDTLLELGFCCSLLHARKQRQAADSALTETNSQVVAVAAQAAAHQRRITWSLGNGSLNNGIALCYLGICIAGTEDLTLEKMAHSTAEACSLNGGSRMTAAGLSLSSGHCDGRGWRDEVRCHEPTDI